MKKAILFISFFAAVLSTTSQNINIPDVNFKNALLNSYCADFDGDGYFDGDVDTDDDGEISQAEALAVLELNVSNSLISSLSGIEFFTNLTTLECIDNILTTLNLQGLNNLKELDCNFNLLTNINLQGLTNLEILHCFGNQLTSLDLQGINNLQELNCSFNQFTSLDFLQGLNNLQELWCHDNQLTSLNLQGLNNLQVLWCNENQLTSLNLQGLNNLQELWCYENQLTSLNLQGLTNLGILYLGANQLSSLDLQGINNLQVLSCYENQLTSLDLQGLNNLQELDCSGNQLTNLNLQGLNNLEYLYCYNNLLSSLDLQGLNNLQYLNFWANQLTSIDLQGLNNLQYLNFWANQLTSIDLQGLNNLQYLNFGANQLTSLDLQGLNNLQNLDCGFNQLTSLDLQGLNNLQNLDCIYNQLNSLYIKNGSNEQFLNFSNNPNLTYICADASQLTQVNNLVTSYGLTNCVVNSYCGFVPGGQFYTIQGENRIDVNNNGCSSLDPNLPHLRFDITNGFISGAIITDSTGMYSIPVQAGTHTITPILENPSYFNVNPSSFQVSFPDSVSPYSQNFCITPNGTHHDLEVVILPLSVARPGFDAYYRIIYKNKGNQVENGNLVFYFDDTRLDFLSSNPTPTQILTDSLSWDFSNLMPFETRSIDVVFNVNTPMEIPPVNGGDSLVYYAHIDGGNTDETHTDNNFSFTHWVVNSYDPNDKTCLEGAHITPAMVGRFVNYMIRFENTGTFSAQNVVVKDVIDTARFDISSLQVQSSSHPMHSRIQGNVVEFIFENIQLPFDSASNDGYVVFKIKTKANLVLGDSLKNKAEIYFDYNFPIITNEAQTVIRNPVIGIQDIAEEVKVSIYPNPASEFLLFQTENNIHKAEIVDAMGRLVMVAAVTNNQINISALEKGVYLIRAYSKETIYRATWVKE